MYRVYLGNLEHNVTEKDLQQLFSDHDLTPSSILIKKGYGFVDCPDQNTFDKTIDKLNGFTFMGLQLQVEPSTVSKRRKSNKIQVTNLPDQLDTEDIKSLLASKGKIQKCDIVKSNLDKQLVVVYDTVEEAQKALEELNNYEYHGSVLQVDFMNIRESRASKHVNKLAGDAAKTEGVYILRLLVPSEYVGAIIGKRGQTIQNITSESKVLKIDVHGKDSSGFIEKAIFIAGKSLSSVSCACKEILKIMQQEASNNNRSEAVLKMLADDRYCGRVIGKEGKSIRKIREDTDTKIVVSGSDDMMSTYPDRIIVIRGTVDNMSRAEEAISSILYQCMEKDLQQRGTGMQYNNYVAPRPSYSAGRSYSTPRYNGMANRGTYSPADRQRPGVRGSSGVDNQKNCYYITVPNTVVGAIIGTGGSNIKQIIRDSNAFVTIETKKDVDANPASDRSVTIKGTPDAFWRASFFIFEKMKMEGFAGNDDVRLRTLMTIPKSTVGRIIGKGGKNARDIEQVTGAIVRITDDPRASDEESLVEVCGTFTATQGALSRIRTIVNLQTAKQARSVSPPRDRGDHQVTSQ
ncbi:hypothetical protein HELRODRAFT_191446 [Helobdella robusta]|uniref:RRM domain-containing protein n=1 Tax=Helobdella robusta TaxID=6412 RepID=T1FSZ9_HELRO|nr:hypothetical protein HELRODRAFT_191446 [Helobdella robusta]ESO05334.1 hypothetical protein HELRODRAFT_191446 [Helobdella robusta]